MTDLRMLDEGGNEVDFNYYYTRDGIIHIDINSINNNCVALILTKYADSIPKFLCDNILPLPAFSRSSRVEEVLILHISTLKECLYPCWDERLSSDKVLKIS